MGYYTEQYTWPPLRDPRTHRPATQPDFGPQAAVTSFIRIAAYRCNRPGSGLGWAALRRGAVWVVPISGPAARSPGSGSVGRGWYAHALVQPALCT